jgi:phosphohistidine phosphatase
MLTLIRHAKSSWDSHHARDFDRPLNKRGRHDAPLMGKHLATEFPRPDACVSSPAVRAQTTARMLMDAAGLPPSTLGLDQRLYDADVERILDVVRETDDRCRDLWVFGHNPGMCDTVHALSGERMEKFPTCGVVRIALSIESWTEIAPHCGKAQAILRPRQLKAAKGDDNT